MAAVMHHGIIKSVVSGDTIVDVYLATEESVDGLVHAVVALGQNRRDRPTMRTPLRARAL